MFKSSRTKQEAELVLGKSFKPKRTQQGWEVFQKEIALNQRFYF
jgi:hypothetical protein